MTSSEGNRRPSGADGELPAGWMQPWWGNLGAPLAAARGPLAAGTAGG